MSASKVSWKSEANVAVLTLEDGKANTFERSTFEDLQKTLGAIAVSPAGSLLLVGRAGFFSAGLDLKVLPAITRDQRVETIRAFGRAMLELFLFPKPTVAAVSGHALGAGAMLALASDVRILTEGPFRFGLNEVPIGMVVPTFGVEIARAAVPTPMLSELVTHGRIFAPMELVSRGAAEAAVMPEQLLATATSRAAALAQLPGAPYANTKLRLRGQAAEWARSKLDDESAELVDAITAGR